MKCEGQRRYGGAFTMGIPEWIQCKNEATVMLTIKQGKEDEIKLPACNTCWQEAIDNKDIAIKTSHPIIK